MTNTMSIEEYRALEPEDDLLTRTIAEAHDRGWLVQHVRPLKSAKGWRTPIQGDKGGPDLTLARKGRVVFIELKGKKGSLEPEQRAWAAAIAPSGGGDSCEACGGCEWYLFRPGDWALIRRVLR